ncbi:MAG: aminotransferase class IV [Bryobacterales bacterium]|nr:aminotransferase class IV [Bryobacterales bacterium]
MIRWGYMHRFLLHNGEIRDTAEKLVSPGQVGLLNGWGVFSTLRVKDGVLFAWERHYARMRKDAAVMRIPFPGDADAFRAALLELIRANHALDSTLRVVVVRNKGGPFEGQEIDRPYDVIAFTKDLAQWGDGVRLAVKRRARLSGWDFAGTKILSWSMNLAWLEEAQSLGMDEMLLLDDRGFVSECTSANLFLVEGDRVWTPPLSCGCLPGVTRAVVLEELRVPQTHIGEREITLQELSAADDVFITSSTRDLLPVMEVDGMSMKQNGRVRGRLQEAFAAYVESYVSEHRTGTPIPQRAM